MEKMFTLTEGQLVFLLHSAYYKGAGDYGGPAGIDDKDEIMERMTELANSKPCDKWGEE